MRGVRFGFVSPCGQRDDMIRESIVVGNKITDTGSMANLHGNSRSMAVLF